MLLFGGPLQEMLWPEAGLQSSTTWRASKWFPWVTLVTRWMTIESMVGTPLKLMSALAP